MSTLNELLDRQNEILIALSSLLEDERVAISKRKTEDIISLAKKKIDFLNHLTDVDKELDNHPERMQLRENPNYQYAIKKLKELTFQCKSYNEGNGELLFRVSLSYNKLRNLLLQSRGKDQMTYNGAGMTENRTSLGTNIQA